MAWKVGKAGQVVAVVGDVGAQHVLQRRADQHVLLPQAHQLAGLQGVVGVEHLGDVLGGVLAPAGGGVVLVVEGVEVEFVDALALPQAQRADALALVADDGHVVGHGPHVQALHVHQLGQVVPAHAPGIAEHGPVVRVLALGAVLVEALLEQAVLVAQAVAVQRDVVGGGAVQEAGGQAAQPAVAQGGVLDVLQVGQVHALQRQALLDVLQHAHGVQVVVHQAAHQVLGGQVGGAAAVQPVGVIVGPLGRDVQHGGLGHGVVQLDGAGPFKGGVGVAHGDLLGAGDQLRAGGGVDGPAAAHAVQAADVGSDGGVVGLGHAPQPVAPDGAGEVHAGLAIQGEPVLHRRDDRVGGGGEAGAQHGVQYVIVVLGHAQRLAGAGLRLVGGVRPPAQRGVVVVGAGVDHAVLHVVLGQVGAVVAVKGELQHLHARIAAPGQQLPGPGLHVAQVLGHDVQVGQGLADAVEQLAPGADLIFAVAGGLFLRGDGVVVGEADEVVDAQDVEQPAHGAQPLDPPGIAGLGVLLPGVQRVAPALAVLLEVVRRHARDADGLAVLVQLEQLRVQPHVAGILGHVDGHVAHDLHAVHAGVIVQPLPLVEEQVLAEDVVVDLVRQLLFVLRHGLGLAQADVLVRPVHPGDLAELRLDGAEQGVAAHPGVVGLEGRDLLAQVVEGGLEGLAQQRVALGLHGHVIHPVGGFQGLVAAPGQYALGLQHVEVDHQRVAREGAGALVGGFRVAGGARWAAPARWSCPRPSRNPRSHRPPGPACRCRRGRAGR